MRKITKIFTTLGYIAIIVSLSTFCLSTFEYFASRYTTYFIWIERICVAVFVLEYITNSIYYKRPFILSRWGILDLGVIVTFFIGVNGSFLRLFRLLRLTKVIKFLRLTVALERIKNSLQEVKQELILFFILAILIIFFAGAGIYIFENEAQPENFSNILDGVWWAIVTLTTVGYGDVYPITVGGKLFTTLIVITGLGIVAIPTGLIASSFAKK